MPKTRDDTFDTGEAAEAEAMIRILNGQEQGQLKALVERIERFEEDKAEVVEAIKEVYAEGKAYNFDVKTMRKVVRIRKQDKAKRAEEDAILDQYLNATGDLNL